MAYGANSYKSLDVTAWYGGIFRLESFLVNIVLYGAVLALVPTMKIPYVSGPGQQTIVIYLLHGFVIKYPLYIDFYGKVDTVLEKFGLLMLGVVITGLLSLKVVEIIVSPLVDPKMKWLFKREDE